MRYPGQNAAGQAPGRRRGPSGQDLPPRPGRGTGRNQPGGESSVFVPGYRGGRPGGPEPAADAARPGSPYGWAGSAASKGPVRGFPPAPGQPPPLYPPGQFSAWNRTPWGDSDGQADGQDADLPWLTADDPAADHAGSGYVAAGAVGAVGAVGGEHPDTGFEPRYSDLAVRDPAADATSTQTWAAVGEGTQASTWTSQRAPGAGPQASAWTTLGAPPDAPPSADPSMPASFPSQAGGQLGPAHGYAGQSDGASVPGTQPGRARGHGTGAHSTGAHSTGAHGTRTGPRPRPRPRKRLSRGLLAAGLAVLVALAGGTYVLLRSGHRSAAAPAAKPTAQHTSPAASASTPAASPTPTVVLGRWGHIDSRVADPLPLTIAQVFPATFTAAASYRRTVSRKAKNCSAAVVGGKLQHAVRQPGCSQVLRASYLSVSKKLMGTIGVLNLSTFAAAENAGKAVGPSEFIAQLAAAKGPTRNLTKGTGIEQAAVKGHYLILVWAEFTTLHKPTTKKQRKKLETFMSLLISKTANVSLTSRMVTGKP